MKTPSLLDLFDGPGGMVGVFGWVCGYSGDALFMDAAVERFVRRTSELRARDGRVALALMLDPTQPALSSLDVPGIAHLALRSAARSKFRLLHAKVALLGFRTPERPGDWCLRLVVSTGNWTTQTLEDSLDLAWSVEVRSGERKNADFAQRSADVQAAHGLLEWLAPLFNQDLLRGAQRDVNQVKHWLKSLDGAAATPRFFDNRDSGLLDKIPRMIRTRSRRSRLAMGSGFFEGQSSGGVPRVLMRIAEALEQQQLLTRHADVSIFVNEDACQAVASAASSIRDRGWKICAPSRPADVFGANSVRTLHAKFLFSFNRQSGSNSCTSSWVYLGSGNLTGPGFVSRARADVGNLEAGVVFEPGVLLWDEDRKDSTTPVATRLLPIGGDVLADAKLQAGRRLPLNGELYLAAPITVLHWKTELGGMLGSTVLIPTGLEVLDERGQPCLPVNGGWRWAGACPRQVKIRWRDDHSGMGQERLVPVLDEWGRLAALPLRSLQFDELASLIDAFPAPVGGDDDDDPPTDDPNGSADSNRPDLTKAGTGTSAIRQIVGQIDRIAAKQSMLDPADWPAWCTRLEQLLVQASESDALETLRALGINPLAVLKAAPFRPPFARDSKGAGGQYEAAIDRVAKAWRVESLHPLGETS